MRQGWRRTARLTARGYIRPTRPSACGPHIKKFSAIEQDIESIRTTVTNNKSAADKAFDSIKGSLDTEIADRQSLENTYKATWVYQNDSKLSQIAAQFNSNGVLKDYSTTEQTATQIRNTVTSYGYITADALNGYATQTYVTSQIDQTASKITNRVSEVEQYAESLEEAWEQGTFNNASGKTLEEMKVPSTSSIRYTRLIPVTTQTAVYLNDGYEVTFRYFDASKKSLGKVSSNSHDGDSGKPLAFYVPSGAVYAAVSIGPDSGTITPAGFRDTGFLVINNKIVTQASLSLYVDKSSVSWLTGSADNVIFNFNNRFQIQHKGTAVLDLDTSGNLYITGKLKENSKIGDNIVIDDNNIIVGTKGGKVEIYTDEVIYGSLYGSGIRGISGNAKSFVLGFAQLNNEMRPYFEMNGVIPYIKHSCNITMNPYSIAFSDSDNYSNYVRIGLSESNGKLDFTVWNWPTSKDEVSYGGVWLDGTTLRVKTS